ncbi:cytochrome P450 [Ramlibacter sp.]|uniref:cytochrome P450 n=1 Tax=Ramlibacter sp. TaxID=1917967 RepID=UPI003D11146D
MDFDFDLYSRETAQNPWPAIKAMQEAGPVLRNVRTGAYMVTTDKLARNVLTDTTRFTIEGTAVTIRFGKEAFFGIDDKALHDKLRSIWMGAFTRPAMEAMRPMITQLADEMIDPVEEKLRAGETVDLEAELCRSLPAYVIAHMMGVPRSYRDDVVRWSDALGAASVLPANADKQTHPAWLAAYKARDEIGAYLAEAIAHRRKNPGGTDLISQIVHSSHNLPDEFIVSNSRQMLYAGNETTAKWLGHIVVALDERKDVRREVLADPKLMPQALEEVMRWRPVVMASVRLVKPGGTEIEGVRIPEGTTIMPVVGCANRDPARYENPEELDIHRKFQTNLGFGFGMHSCLGVTLARLEAQIVIERLLARIPDYEVAGDVIYNAFALRGPKVLPIAMH